MMAVCSLNGRFNDGRGLVSRPSHALIVRSKDRAFPSTSIFGTQGVFAEPSWGRFPAQWLIGAAFVIERFGKLKMVRAFIAISK